MQTHIDSLPAAPVIPIGIPTGTETGIQTRIPSASSNPVTPTRIDLPSLSRALRVGDVVFTRIGVRLFHKIAQATGSWTNHVGIVVAISGTQVSVAESRVPLSGTTTFQRFVSRSERGRVAIGRLRAPPLTPAQQIRLLEAVRQRSGVLYDTGFNLHSRGQFCSRFVREVLADAVGVDVGDIESFAQLLARHPEVPLGFWRLWYLGRIPWNRETVTPASLLHSPALQRVFDGNAVL